MASFRFPVLHGILKGIRNPTTMNYRSPSRSILWTSAISVRQEKVSRPGHESRCFRRVNSTLLSDESERDLLDKRIIFVRDAPGETPNVKEKLREYFSIFGEVENVWRVKQDMLFVPITSAKSANIKGR